MTTIGEQLIQEGYGEKISMVLEAAPPDGAAVLRHLLSAPLDKPIPPKSIAEVAPSAERALAKLAVQLRQEGRRQGIAEGRAAARPEGLAEALLLVLDARGLRVGAEQRNRIIDCQEVPELDRWLRRAATASAVAEVFSR